MPSRRWVGGTVASHEELDRVDAEFWRDAGPAARFEASIELAFQVWSLKHPDAPPPRFGRDAFGVRKVRRPLPGHAHDRPRISTCGSTAPVQTSIRRAPHLRSSVSQSTSDEIVWIGRPPARGDFLQTIPGATFAIAWKRRVDLVSGKLVVRVIGREDLLNNKRAVGRPQDLRDVRAIERARPPPKRTRKTHG